MTIAASSGRAACPEAIIVLDKISGCDFYCEVCGARHHEVCKLVRHDHYTTLRTANIARNIEWTGNKKLTPTWRSAEMTGEVAEFLDVALAHLIELSHKTGIINNTLKKLERAGYGMVGSRASIEQLENEAADIDITLDLVCMDFNIDRPTIVARKFNATSAKNNLKTRLALHAHESANPSEGAVARKDRGMHERPISREDQGGAVAHHFPDGSY